MILMLERNLWEKALPIKLCNNNIKKGNNQYLCYHKIILKHYHEEVKNHNVVLTYNIIKEEQYEKGIFNIIGIYSGF